MHEFGGKKDEVETPKEILRDLKKVFKVKKFFDPCPFERKEGWDGLVGHWENVTFCNPPYSQIDKWLAKGVEECQKRQVKSIFFVPARTYTKYWGSLVFPEATELWFFEGGVKFTGYDRKCPFGVVLIIYDPQKKRVENPPSKIGSNKINILYC